MAKHIVICADGTGNTALKGRGTNVFKLYEAVDQHGHRFEPDAAQQVAIYHDGVGTEEHKWVRILGGGFGWGLSRNVKQLYGELARVYDPGDKIFLFGFSRGAFTVRTLAGLVLTCGIVDPQKHTTNRAFRREIRAAYQEYRRKYQTRLSRLVRGKIALDPTALRARFSQSLPAFLDESTKVIEFIGVWDTVDAVGSPLGLANLINETFYRFKFPDRTLSPKVGRACHALALDEERESFTPLLWEEGPDDHDRISQVWFAGVHSNVGGGYPRQGMSLVALDWMMRESEARGLRFTEAQRDLYRDATDVNDKLSDSRSGLGVFYRWKPRNVLQLCRDNHITPKIHRTVLQRIARNTEGYAPGSLPPDAEVVTSSSPPISESLRALIAERHGTDSPLLARDRSALVTGRIAYALMLAATLGIVAMMLWTYYGDVQSASGWRARAVQFVTTVASSNWFAVAARTAWHYPALPVVAVSAMWLMNSRRRYLDDRYSDFWHGMREPLRKVLESARHF
jgi:uncharacterized protein (DUF2235 family)